MRAHKVRALVVVTALVAGCGMLQPEPNPFTTGSQWVVVSVGGESTEGKELILTFIGESATLSSECGASVGTAAVEPEGHDLTFGAFQGPAARPTCSEEAMYLHELAAGALPGVDRWERSGDVTQLLGERTIRLEPQHTDT